MRAEGFGQDEKMDGEGLVEETEAFSVALRHIEAVKKLSKDDSQALTANALLAIRDGIEHRSRSSPRRHAVHRRQR